MQLAFRLGAVVFVCIQGWSGPTEFSRIINFNWERDVSSVVECLLIVCDGLLDRSFMVDPLSYYSFQPVLHDWCHKGHGMCYPV